MKNSLLLLLFFILPCNPLYPSQPSLKDPSFSFDLSPEDLASLEQEVENIVNQMSPEQRKQLEDMMVRMEEFDQKNPGQLDRFMSGKMSEIEMEQVLKDIVPEELLEEISPPTQEPTMEEKESEKEPEETPEEKTSPQAPAASEDIQKLAVLVERTAKNSAQFLAHLAVIPDVDDRVNRWIKQKKITGVPAEKDFITLRSDVQKTEQLLRTFLEIDRKTNKYKYLPYLHTEKQIVEKIQTLDGVLSKTIGKIEVSPFGVEKLKSGSKKAIRTILNGYSEALYTNTLTESLKTVLAKHDPEAKKSAEAEDAARKKAEEASKKAPSARPLPTVGREVTESDIYRPSGPYHEQPVYSSSSGQPYSSSYDLGGNSFESSRYRSVESSLSPVTAAVSEPKTVTQPKTPATPSPALKNKSEEAAVDTDIKDKKEKNKPIKDSIAAGLVKDINKKLYEATELLTAPELKNIEKTLTSKEKTNEEFIVTTLPQVMRLLGPSKGVLDDMGRLKNRMKQTTMSDIQKRELLQELATNFASYEKPLLSITTQIDALDSRWSHMKVNEKRLKAYLGQTPAQYRTQKGKGSAEAGYTLYDLYETIKEIQKGIGQLVK